MTKECIAMEGGPPLTPEEQAELERLLRGGDRLDETR
jgi:hypothetical protein